MRGIVAHARRCARTDGSALKRTLLFRHFSTPCVCGCAKTLCPTQKWCERRLEGRGVQDKGSMKPRFRNADLLITYVVDSCVKLLAVLHISSAQDRSVDLCRVFICPKRLPFTQKTTDHPIAKQPSKQNSYAPASHRNAHSSYGPNLCFVS